MPTPLTMVMPLTRGEASSAISAAIQPPMEFPTTVTSPVSKLVKQRHVEPGEPGHGVQRLGPGGAAEAGVGRGDHPGGPGPGQQGGETGDRAGSAAAVQQQERPARTLLVDGEVDGADAVELDGCKRWWS